MIVRYTPSQLPMWPDALRGGPNVLLRSALFAGIASKKRRFIGIQTSPEKEPEGVELAAQDGQVIKYAGTQLNQYDADVFFEVLHRSRRHNLGAEAIFTGASFLKSIGRSRNNLNYEDLDDSLRRLVRGTVDVTWRIGGKPHAFAGNLISNYTRQLDDKLYRVVLAPELKALFAPASWTQLEWQERRTLKGKPLAQWLHSYFSTHAKPFPVSVAFLKEKTGSPTRQQKHFKVELRAALEAMQEAIGWIVEWDGDLITVTRPPTGSQARHLERTGRSRKALAEVRARLIPNPSRPASPEAERQGGARMRSPGVESINSIETLLGQLIGPNSRKH